MKRQRERQAGNCVRDMPARLRRLTWNQVYRDKGLHWEKIISVKPPSGIAAVYSLRITQSRRAVAYRDGDFIRLLAIPPDHDAAYGRK
ncbi:MAG: hypothetical protein AB7G13_05565 [Lautropia sp.]